MAGPEDLDAQLAAKSKEAIPRIMNFMDGYYGLVLCCVSVS